MPYFWLVVFPKERQCLVVFSKKRQNQSQSQSQTKPGLNLDGWNRASSICLLYWSIVSIQMKYSIVGIYISKLECAQKNIPEAFVSEWIRALVLVSEASIVGKSFFSSGLWSHRRIIRCEDW
jgi:hypothetical protein